jgi:hypothetical protein
MPRPSYALDDAELQELIDELTPVIRRKTALSVILGIVGFVCASAAFICLEILFEIIHALGFGLAAFFAGTFAAMAGMTAAQKKKKLKFAVSDSVVRCALAARFEVEKYMPGSFIHKMTILQAGLIHRSWNKISGSDLLEGKYKGISFTFSDLHLEMETTDNKGRKRRATKFKGQWLILGLAKPLTFGVQLRGRKGGSGSGKSAIETESIEFNKRFQIIAASPHNAFYILTPDFMEQILKADKRANARMLVSFDGDKMHIALDSRRDLFELSDKKKMFAANNIPALRMQMKWDVNYIANIIDELLVNETLFNAEVKNDAQNQKI